MFSPRQIFLPAVYHTESSFSSLRLFMGNLRSELDKTEGNKDQVLKTINRVIQEFNALPLTAEPAQETARKLLIAHDLKAIKEKLVSMDVERTAARLDLDMENMVTRAEAEGLLMSDVEVYLVDSFPAPFSDMNWAYFNADKNDEKRYGIPFGIYVKRPAVIPIYTSYVIAHELIHVSIGLADATGIARGLEEGLADLFGSIFLFSKSVGFELARNLLIYNRFPFPATPFWDVYLDNLRMAGALYRYYGLDGVKDLLRSGRSAIRQAEASIHRGHISNLGLAKGHWDPDVDQLVDLLFTYPRNHVVSPLAKYLSQFLEVGASISEKLETLGIDQPSGMEAAKELQTKLFLIVIRDDEVASSELPSIGHLLRYDPTRGGDD